MPHLFRIWSILVLCSACILQVRGQNIWNLDQGRLLKFDSASPYFSYHSEIDDTYIFSSGVSSCDGKLLFYDRYSRSFRNSNHELVRDYGKSSGYHTRLLAVNWGVNLSQYLLHENDVSRVTNVFSKGRDYGVYTTVLDQSFNGGDGSPVPGKTDQLLLSGSPSAITITHHGDGTRKWILIPTRDSTLYAFLWESDTINSVPVKSKIRTSNGFDLFEYGDLKVSSDGKTIVLTGFFDSIGHDNAVAAIAYEFDPWTGKASKPNVLLRFKDLYQLTHARGVEFSPNDSLIYISSIYLKRTGDTTILSKDLFLATNVLLQIDRYSGKVEEIQRFRIPRVTASYNEFPNLYSLQRAPDGKIYVSIGDISYLRANSLGVIHRPNERGKACQFERDWKRFSKPIPWRLPKHNESLPKLYLRSNLYQSPCQDTAVFHVSLDSRLKNYRLYFGNGDSLRIGNPSYTSDTAIQYVYSKEGKYHVVLAAEKKACSYTYYVSDSIEIRQIPESSRLNLAQDVYCDSVVVNISDSVLRATRVYVSWGDGTLRENIELSNSSGKWSANHPYTFRDSSISVSVQYANDKCAWNFDTLIAVQPYAYPEIRTALDTGSLHFVGDTIYSCLGSSLTLYDSSLWTESLMIRWGDGDSIVLMDSLKRNQGLEHEYVKSGLHAIVLRFESRDGCTHSDTIWVRVLEEPVASLDLSERSTCLEGNEVIFSVKPVLVSPWDSLLDARLYFGDSIFTEIPKSNDIDYKYSYDSAGLYHAGLVLNTSYGCTTQLDDSVRIFPNPVADLLATKDTQCLNFNQFQLENSSYVPGGNIDSVVIHWGNGATEYLDNSPPSLSHSYNSAGSFHISVELLSQKGCAALFIDTFTVYPSPLATFRVSDTFLCSQESELFLQNQSSMDAGSISKYVLGFQAGTNQSYVELDSVRYAFPDSGSYKIQLVAISDLGCSDTAHQNVRVAPTPKVNVGLEDICQFETAEAITSIEGVSGESLYVEQWRWNQDQWQSRSYDFKAIVSDTMTETGSFEFEHILWTDEGCTDTSRVTASVHPEPESAFSYYLTDKENRTALVQLKLKSPSSGQLTWLVQGVEVGSTSPLHFDFRDTGKFLVESRVVSDQGCIGSTLENVFIYPFAHLFVPNSFTPNDDGVNDTYSVPINDHMIRAFRIRIFNRWGEIVFKSDRPDEPWSGEGSLPGVYAYLIEYQDNFLEWHQEFGSLRLIR